MARAYFSLSLQLQSRRCCCIRLQRLQSNRICRRPGLCTTTRLWAARSIRPDQSRIASTAATSAPQQPPPSSAQLQRLYRFLGHTVGRGCSCSRRALSQAQVLFILHDGQHPEEFLGLLRGCACNSGHQSFVQASAQLWRQHVATEWSRCRIFAAKVSGKCE